MEKLVKEHNEEQHGDDSSGEEWQKLNEKEKSQRKRRKSV